MSALRRVLCSDIAPAAGAAPPTEFRIFRAGENPSTKGVFVFDDKAAAAVLAAYQTQGVEYMIDLEHHALGEANREDSADARGWFKIELRAGELWAVDVRWTPDGARRLSEKTQRYISPAFLADEDGRIAELINVALVAMPATHGAPALVAAARTGAHTTVGYTGGSRPQVTKLSMDPKQVQAALDAIESGDQAKALEILKSMIAAAAGGGDASADAGADAMSDTAATPADKPEEELAALRRQVEALAKGQSAEIVALRATVATLTAEREAKDQIERVALVGELVKLGYETPATAWEGEPEKLQPAKRLQAEPVADLKARVEILRKAPRATNHEAPKGEAAEVELSKEELAATDKIKDPEARARFVQLRLSRKVKSNG